jgi:hypothetical protein
MGPEEGEGQERVLCIGRSARPPEVLLQVGRVRRKDGEWLTFDDGVEALMPECELMR